MRPKAVPHRRLDNLLERQDPLIARALEDQRHQRQDGDLLLHLLCARHEVGLRVHRGRVCARTDQPPVSVPRPALGLLSETTRGW
jgi:hypothetical protein